ANRILMEGNRAVGIEYAVGNEVERVYATREVILSGGTYNSPQLLMLSGIGPAAHLSEMGIKTLADLPVGENLQDHWAAAVMYARKEPGPFQGLMRFDR